MATRRPIAKTVLVKLRKQLEAEREMLIAQTVELEATADVGSWRDSGFDDDYADTGSATFERERAQSLAMNAKRILQRVEDALVQMDNGTYGICERCGNPIERERLEALPYATLCVADARREEHDR